MSKLLEPVAGSLGTTYEIFVPPPVGAPRSCTACADPFLDDEWFCPGCGVWLCTACRNLEEGHEPTCPENADPEPPNASRWGLLRVAAKLLPGERVSSCRCVRINSDHPVEVWSSPKGSFYTNVQRCGSVWMCPVCVVRVTEGRRLELQEALGKAPALDFDVYLVTSTIPHHSGSDPRALSDGLLAARTKMRNRKTFRTWSKSIGTVGCVRSLEVVYGANGAHPHIHELIFCRKGSRKPVAADLLPLWQSACQAVGLPEPNEHGIDIRNGEKAASYVGKWGLEDEMTKTHTKRGRLGSRTAWDLLRDAAAGDVVAGELFKRHAMAFKGRKQLVWSKGLRSLLGLGVEKTDSDLAEESKEQASRVGGIDSFEWQLVVRYNMRERVLRAVDRGGWPAAAVLIARLTALWDRRSLRKHGLVERRCPG